MNCKPGDLAVYVGINEIALGSIVEVLRPWRYAHNPRLLFRWDTTPTRGGFCVIADDELRPIRDQPGADETLTWAGLPAPLKTMEPA